MEERKQLAAQPKRMKQVPEDMPATANESTLRVRTLTGWAASRTLAAANLQGAAKGGITTMLEWRARKNSWKGVGGTHRPASRRRQHSPIKLEYNGKPAKGPSQQLLA